MIYFEPLEKFHLPLLKKWRNSDTVMPYVREYRYLNDGDQEKWYDTYIQSRRKSDFDQEILLISDDDGRIGVGGFTRIEWKNRKAEITFYSFEGRSIKEALESIINKGFNEFGFHKVTWPVYTHDPNLPLYQSIFDVEAILKDEYYYKGWQHRVYLSLKN